MNSAPQVIRLLFEMNRVFLITRAAIHTQTISNHSDLVGASRDYLYVFDRIITELKTTDLGFAYDTLFLHSIWALLSLFYLQIYKNSSLAKNPAKDGILAILRGFIEKLIDLDGTVVQRGLSCTPETQLKLDLLLNHMEDINRYLTEHTNNPSTTMLANLLNGIAQPQRAKATSEKSAHASRKKSELQQIIDMLSGEIDPLEFLGYLTTAQIGDDSDIRPLLKKLPYFIKQSDMDSATATVPLTSNSVVYLCFLIILKVRYGSGRSTKQDMYIDQLKLLFDILLRSKQISSTYGPYFKVFLKTLQSVLTFPAIALFSPPSKEHTQETFMDTVTRPRDWSFYSMCGIETAKEPLLLMVYAHCSDLAATAEHISQMTRINAIIEYAECLSKQKLIVSVSKQQSAVTVDTASTGIWKLAIDYYRWSLPRNADINSKNRISDSIQNIIYSKLLSATSTSDIVDLLYIVTYLEMGPALEIAIKKGAAQLFERKSLVQDAALWYRRAGKIDELKALVNRALKEAIRVAMTDIEKDRANMLFAAIEAMISNIDMDGLEIANDIALAKNIKLFREHIASAQESYDKRRQHAKEIQTLAYDLVSSPGFFLNVVPAVVADACFEGLGTHINASQFEELSLGFQRSLKYYASESYLPKGKSGRCGIASTQYELCSKLAEIYMKSTDKIE